jgi:hypothetical protein
MPDYVTNAAKIEATGAALAPCQLQARLIHRPDLALDAADAEEVVPTPTTH